jgi:hypothetical protein
MAVVSFHIPDALAVAAQEHDTLCVALHPFDYWEVVFDTDKIRDYHVLTDAGDMALRICVRDGVCYAVIWRESDNWRDVYILTPGGEWIQA